MTRLSEHEASTFTCSACGRTFPKLVNDAEAMAEAAQFYPPEMLEDAAVICDDCLQGMNQ